MKAAIYVFIDRPYNNVAYKQLEEQAERLLRTAKRKGYEVSDDSIYGDTAPGGASTRPGLYQLMTDAKANKFEVVLVNELGTMGYSPSTVHVVVDVLQMMDVSVEVSR